MLSFFKNIYILAITHLLTYVSVLGKHVLAVHQFDSRIEMLRVCSTLHYNDKQITQGGKGNSEGKKVQQSLTSKLSMGMFM